MILSIGEILADIVIEGDNKKMYCGGAPFNLAVNVTKCGGKAGFIGRVGCDQTGDFLSGFAQKIGFDYLSVEKDSARSTTLAFVKIVNGERNFSFFMHDTADMFIEAKNLDLSNIKDLNIINIGSLMLRDEYGRAFADKIIKKAKKAGVKISFDMNFREDLFDNKTLAKQAYLPIIKSADIVKFSKEELYLYTGEKDLVTAVQKFDKNKIVLVTLGEDGSFFSFNNKYGFVKTKKVVPVDSTGAGDSFFGCFLSMIDGQIIDEPLILKALNKANEAGAKTTQFYGAIKTED